MLGTTMEIGVTRPFIVFSIPGDQYGGPDYLWPYIILYCFTEINLMKLKI